MPIGCGASIALQREELALYTEQERVGENVRPGGETIIVGKGGLYKEGDLCTGDRGPRAHGSVASRTSTQGTAEAYGGLAIEVEQPKAPTNVTEVVRERVRVLEE